MGIAKAGGMYGLRPASIAVLLSLSTVALPRTALGSVTETLYLATMAQLEGRRLGGHCCWARRLLDSDEIARTALLMPGLGAAIGYVASEPDLDEPELIPGIFPLLYGGGGAGAAVAGRF